MGTKEWVRGEEGVLRVADGWEGEGTVEGRNSRIENLASGVRRRRGNCARPASNEFSLNFA